MSGTSMAAPNVTGTIALLAEHYENRFGAEADGATKKGLVIHTAADAGNPGPDYAFGWGLVNAADAAVFTSNAAVGAGGDTIIQGTYTGTPLTFRFANDGTRPIKATLVWMDPPGQVHPPDVLDVRTRTLVHDLDLSIVDGQGTLFHPWTLNPETPAGPAVRTGPNRVDNVEQVVIDNTQLGVYRVRVSDFSNVTDQPFTLLVSGANSLDAVGTQPLPPEPEIVPIGPQLIGARPNEGHLLLPDAANEELGVAPRELQLLFQGGGDIATASDLSQSIRITRQGADGAFDYAYAKTDFYTGAAASELDRVELTDRGSIAGCERGRDHGHVHQERSRQRRPPAGHRGQRTDDPGRPELPGGFRDHRRGVGAGVEHASGRQPFDPCHDHRQHGAAVDRQPAARRLGAFGHEHGHQPALGRLGRVGIHGGDCGFRRQRHPVGDHQERPREPEHGTVYQRGGEHDLRGSECRRRLQHPCAAIGRRDQPASGRWCAGPRPGGRGQLAGRLGRRRDQLLAARAPAGP
jgi:hypothetical protein